MNTTLLREVGLRGVREHVANAARVLSAIDTKDTIGFLGLSDQEVRSYSVLRALGEAAAMARARQGWNLSGIEGEAHRELVNKHGELESPAAFYIPVDIQRRDLTASVAGSGGYLVGSAGGGSYIEVLRNRALIFRLGAQSLPGQRENLALPTLASAGTASWLSTESTQASESTQAFGQVNGAPKTVAAYTELSRQITLQSNPAAEAIVMADLAAVTAIALDAAAINGPGSSGRPLGILNTPSIGTFSGTTLGLAALTEAQQDILDGNAVLNQDALGYASTPGVAKLLKNRQRFTGTDSPLWQGALHDGSIESVRAISSNQMPSATMIYGDWSQVLVPEWGVLAVEVNNFANFPAGIIGLRAMWCVDVIVRHAASFTVATSIT
jgi:HK97 family phage major capsid protein